MIQPTDESTADLLRDSAALEIELAAALIERDPRPEELAPDEESRCKYLSKCCLHLRSTKAKGVLHNLCTHHRAKAILNQRRLELRKRCRPESELLAGLPARVTTRRSTCAIQATISKSRPKKRKRAISAPAVAVASAPTSATVMLPPINVNEDAIACAPSKPKCRKSTSQGKLSTSPRDVHDIEPCRTPATLYPEDIEELWWLVEFDTASVVMV